MSRKGLVHRDFRGVIDGVFQKTKMTTCHIISPPSMRNCRVLCWSSEFHVIVGEILKQCGKLTRKWVEDVLQNNYCHINQTTNRFTISRTHNNRGIISTAVPHWLYIQQYLTTLAFSTGF